MLINYIGRSVSRRERIEIGARAQRPRTTLQGKQLMTRSLHFTSLHVSQFGVCNCVDDLEFFGMEVGVCPEA